MLRSSTLLFHFVANAALVIGVTLLAATPAVAGDDGDDPWDPAMSTSDTLDHHQGHSRDPDSITVESEDLDDNLGHSEDLDDNLAQSEDPDEMVAESGDLDSHVEESVNLQDLETEKPDDGFEPIVPASQAAWGTTDDPRVLVARDHVVRAEERAQRARDRYGRMMNANYPRGDARVRVVHERDESMQALEEAQRELRALEGNP